MTLADVRIQVCDSQWNPRGELKGWDGLERVTRVCDVGRGKVDAAATGRNRELLQPGATVLVSINGQVSGGLIDDDGEDQPIGPPTIKVAWADTNAYLAAQKVFPNPDTDTGQGANEFDRRSGLASSVVLGYVAANIGPDALDWRRAPGLTIQRDPQIGGLIEDAVEARWDNLLDLCRQVAMTNGIVFDVVTSDRDHLFRVRPMRDLTGEAQFSRELRNLGVGSCATKAPKATRVVGLGKGEGTARVAVMVTSAESRRQEASWGRALVAVQDSSSADTASLRAECLRVLSEQGETVEIQYDLTQSGLRYGTDYLTGDLVSVRPEGWAAAVTKPVREVTERVSLSGGYTVTAVIGDYQATSSTGAQFTTRQIVRQVEALKARR